MADRSSSKKRQSSKTGEPASSADPAPAQPTRQDFLRYVLAEPGAEDFKPITDPRYGRGGRHRRQRTPSPETVYTRIQQWKKDHPGAPVFGPPAPPELGSKFDSDSDFDSESESESESRSPSPQPLQIKASRARIPQESPHNPSTKPTRPDTEEYAYDRPSSAKSRIAQRFSVSHEGTEAAVEDITAKTSSLLKTFLTSPLFRAPAAILLVLLFLRDILPAEYTGNYCRECPVRWWLLIPVPWLLRLDIIAHFVLGIAEAVLVGYCRGIGAFGRDLCFLFLILSVLGFHFFVLLFFGPIGFLVVLSITWTAWYFCIQGLFRSWRSSYRYERRRGGRRRRRYSGY